MNKCNYCSGENGAHEAKCPTKYPIMFPATESYIQHKIINLPLLAEILAIQAEIEMMKASNDVDKSAGSYPRLVNEFSEKAKELRELIKDKQ